MTTTATQIELHNRIQDLENAIIETIRKCGCKGRGGWEDGDEDGFSGEWIDCRECRVLRHAVPGWERMVAEDEDQERRAPTPEQPEPLGHVPA